MIEMFSFIGTPLGWIMYAINSVVQNYGFTLIVFSVMLKILMIPIGIKQQKGLIVNAKMSPKMKELQRMYGGNKQKYSEELQKLYDREKFSPLSSCLPMLIQFPILFGMLDVIYYPIKHMLRMPAETIDQAVVIATGMLGEAGMNAYSKEISVLQAVNMDAQPFVQGLGAETAGILAKFDFTMFGLFLGDQPTLMPEGKPLGLYFALLLIPILSGATSTIMSLSTMKSTPAMDSQAAGMSKSMMIMMPLMSVWISFIVPAGVGIYWLISNILSSIQTIILNRIMNPAEEIAKAEAAEKERQEKERQERIEAKKLAKETGASTSTKEPHDEKTLSQKELNRRKLAEARRRDAERYGEEYVEVTDDDIK